MNANATWVIVSHRAGARILEHKSAKLSLVSEIDHEAGRLKDGEINTDRPGRSYDRGNGGGNERGAAGPQRSAMSTEESAHEHVANMFARELADVLRQGRNDHRYARLVLVAEPRFLGMLRNALDDTTAGMVAATVGKDLAQVPLQELPGYLGEAMEV
jgi:protein required for attachment to host cells